MISDIIEKLIQRALDKFEFPNEEFTQRQQGVGAGFTLEHPADLSHGDYSANIALILSKKMGEKPRDIAEKIAEKIKEELPPEIEKIEVAGAGFINFYLSPKFFTESLNDILNQEENFGKNNLLAGKKIMVDFTDPNPFKEFHIGHLMSNAIGESLCRIFEKSGAKVVRVCYQGDVGLHIAKAIWGIIQNKKDFPKDSDSLEEKITFLGKAYVLGSQKYEDEKIAEEIKEINKKVFEKSDAFINEIYEKGRQWSIDHFEGIYKKLGTKFDYYFPESSVIEDGLKIVKEFLKKGIFEESEGAIIYRGEKFGLHTRVFINSQGLPTYECKDMGLAKKKSEAEKNLDLSLIVTGNEQNDYFKVVFSALSFLSPEYAKISKHIGHGMLKFAEGKMSSRKGNVITGESLLEKVKNLALSKMDGREFSVGEKEKIAEEVAVGAVKYSILRQSIGSDIVFDFNKSISFEGDSGPYLQYTYVRAKSVLTKAEKEGIKGKISDFPDSKAFLLERFLCRFSEVVARAGKEYAPHLVTTYLTELAAAFNSYYAKNQIVSKDDPASSYKVALTSAFTEIMKNGLWLLGIQTPEKM